MWIKRRIANEILIAARTRPALAVIGPRQIGKSSLLQNLFPQAHYVTLDSVPEATLAENNPTEFLTKHPTPLIIDEVQYAPALLRQLKQVIDQNRSSKGLFLLSGSQSFALMQGITESLAGRIEIFPLEGLTHSELADAQISSTVWQMIGRGGFPELWTTPELSTPRYFSSYISTYLERDVRNFLQIGNLRDFDRFLRACALRSAQTLNKSDLARDIGVSPSTIAEWLSVLEASRLVHLVEPWFNNKTKSLVKSPKLFLSDTGLLCALLQIDSAEQIKTHPNAGAIWETFVLSEIRRNRLNRGNSNPIYYWSDRRREVDFVYEQDGLLFAADAKLKELPTVSDTNQLLHFYGLLSPQQQKRTKLGLITPQTQSFPLAITNPKPTTVDVMGLDQFWG